MPTLALNSVIDSLTVAFDAAPALDGVVVSKGKQILPVGDLEHLFVASDGDPDSDRPAAIFEIEWPGVGGGVRTENGSVTCTITAATGDQDAMAGQITRAAAILDACVDVLRGNPSLGSTTALLVKVREGELRTVQDSQGCAAVVEFTVSYMSSI